MGRDRRHSVAPVARVDDLAAQALAGRAHRAFAALQAQVQRLAVVAGGADRQWLPAPFGQPGQCLAGIHFQAQAQALARPGQHLQGNLGEQAKAAEAARHQPRYVVAGDILHYLAAKAQVLAVAGDQSCAQDIVAHRACPGPARPRKPGGDHAAQRRLGPQVRRLARQHLPGLAQRRLDLPQRRAGTGGEHQFGGVVADDTAVPTGVDKLAGHRAAEHGLAVAALDAQRGALAQRLADLLQQLLAEIARRTRRSAAG
ncbi:hypothetical protein WR25_22334 [Diploscapter pachys]|uniref:Uncharacterized protein n=1 Tax=Diploscapter pachys TaxID=2018661 RepID=A0A2A2KA70_9BILA|nr:hypothetical protein WR25_22334 [Diploscapter pachys]